MEHYKNKGIETIDIIENELSSMEFIGFCRGNVFKYISRLGKKGDPIEDLKKARDYIDYMITHTESQRLLEEFNG